MRTYGNLVLPLAAALALAACGDSGTASGGAPSLSIRLHDAPGDLKEAWVKVDQVSLQGTSSTDSTSGKVVLLSTPTGWMNLTQLTGASFNTLVNGAQVPAGTYSQLRFVICNAYVVTQTRQVYATSGATLPAGVTATGTLQLPSGCQSGLKVKLPGGGVTIDNGASILSVDFDVSQSFGHQAGASGKWVMHPVLQATNVSFSGTISGTVALGTGVTLPACGGSAVDVTRFVPRAAAGADSVSGAVQPGGTYSISVAPATYAMTYVPAYSFTNGDSLSVTAAPSTPSATVASGGNTTVSYTISAASCKPHP